jgi:hypothetical protein
MMNLKKNNIAEFALTLIVTGVIALAIYFMLPVRAARYDNRDDGVNRPFGNITAGNPLDYCMQGQFEDINGLEIYTATYRRKNTNINHLKLYESERGVNGTIYETDFSSQFVADNEYFKVLFPKTSVNGTLCLSVTSSGATPQNAITVWLNRKGAPIIRLDSSDVPVSRAISFIRTMNVFPIPFSLAVAICFLYIFVNMLIITYIFRLGSHDEEKTSKPANH